MQAQGDVALTAVEMITALMTETRKLEGWVGAALVGTGKIDVRKAVAGCPSRRTLATNVEKLKTWVDQLDAALKAADRD